MHNFLRWGGHLLILAVILTFGCAKSAQDLYKDGLAELEANNLDTAQERLEAAVLQDPTLVTAYRHLVRIYELKRQPDQVAKTLERWIEQEPFNNQARFELARQYLRQGEFDRSLKLYEELTRSAVNDQERRTYQRMLDLLVRAREREERIHQLKVELASNPDDPLVNHELGVIYFKVGQSFVVAGRSEMGRGFMEQSLTLIERAKLLLEKTLDAEPQAADARIELASVYYDLGQYHLFEGRTDEAVATFRQATELNPHDAKSYFVLSQIFNTQKDTKQAIAMIREAIERQPDSALYQEVLSGYYLALEDYVSSEAALQEADRLSPSSGKYLFNLAILYERQGKAHSEVIPLIEKAIAKEPGNPQYRFSLAGFLGQEGQFEESIAQLREVIRVGGGTEWEGMARQMITRTEQQRASRAEE